MRWTEWPKPLKVIIYLIEGNGKQYVGQTSCPMNRRWNDHVSKTHVGKRRCTYLYRAIQKHGKDKFKMRLLEVVDWEEADEAEERYIECFDTMAPKGYNLHTGGNSNRNSCLETRKAISKGTRAAWAKPETKEKRRLATEARRDRLKEEIAAAPELPPVPDRVIGKVYLRNGEAVKWRRGGLLKYSVEALERRAEAQQRMQVDMRRDVASSKGYM